MKVKILTIALLSTIILISAPVSLTQNRKRAKQSHKVDRWYTMVGPNGDFTISFPEKPTREPDRDGSVTPIRIYGLYTNDPNNPMYYTINFQNLPDPSLGNEWNDIYERGILTKDNEEKRHVVSKRRIGKNTFETEVWDSSSDNGDLNYMRQTIIRRGSVYTLLCSSEVYGRKVEKSLCRRFFDSLHFVDSKITSVP